MCTPTSYTPINKVTTSMINRVHVFTRKHIIEVHLVKSLCNVEHHPDPLKYNTYSTCKDNYNDKELHVCVSNFQRVSDIHVHVCT